MTFEEQASGASMSIGGTTWVTTALADQRPWRNPEATGCHQGAAHRRRPSWALSAPIASAPRTCRRQRAMTTSPQASLPAAGAWRALWRVDDKKAPPAAQGDASPTASAPAISSWCRLPRLAHSSDPDSTDNGGCSGTGSTGWSGCPQVQSMPIPLRSSFGILDCMPTPSPLVAFSRTISGSKSRPNAWSNGQHLT